MAIKESDLTAIEAIGVRDLLRTVTAAGESRNASVAVLAKTVLETYEGSEISGKPQSVVEAVSIDDAVIDLYETMGLIE